MSDLYIKPTVDGGEIIIIDGEPQTTSDIGNAVYLSLYTGAWWGNAISDTTERYDSTLDDLFSRPLTNQIRLKVKSVIENLLEWTVTTGLAASVDVDAEIPSVGTLYIKIVIQKPNGTNETFAYAINWEAQEAILL